MSTCSGKVTEPPETAAGLTGRLLVAAFALAAAADAAPVLPADHGAFYVERFNAADDTSVVNLVPNDRAAEWIAERAPRFDCPSMRMVETYYFRWWTYRKHIKATPQGRVLTEFLTPVSHAGAYNTISCAVGHHVAEGRWLRDAGLLDEYLRFWFRGADSGPQPHFHKYSGWVAAAVDERRYVTGDDKFAFDLLDDLVADYRRWEEERLTPEGLFWQYDVQDGMEESISGGRRVQNVRPTINCYMTANAFAIGRIATDAGRPDIWPEFNRKGADLLTKLPVAMWDADAQFYKVRLASGDLSDAREAIGYLPWMFGFSGPGNGEAWRQVQDAGGFWAPRGLTTAERRHPRFRSHGTGTCEWDGAVWPFATSQTLTAMANALRGPWRTPITNREYFEQLLRYAEAHEKDGAAYIGEYHDEVTGEWLIKGEKEKRSRCYNHSTFCDLVISGLVGVLPLPEESVVVEPLLPDDAWDWFCLDGVPYRGHELTVIWDRDGTRYGRGAGLRLLIDGVEAGAADGLERIKVDLPSERSDGGAS